MQGTIERLVQEYGERAFQFAYRLTGNVGEAKELTQEAFYRALKNWESYDHSQPVDHWFFTILRNLFLDGLKRFDKTNVLSLDMPAEDAEEDYAEILEERSDRILETLEREESGKKVREALERLTAEHRAVLTLADLEGLPYEDIAKVIRCPVGTVRSRVSRARNALKRQLLQEAGIRD